MHHYYHLRLHYRPLPDKLPFLTDNLEAPGPWTETVVCVALPWPIEHVSDIREVEAWCDIVLRFTDARLLAWTPLAGTVRPGAEPYRDIDIKVMRP